MNQLGGFFKSYAIVNMITVVLYLIISLYQGGPMSRFSTS